MQCRACGSPNDADAVFCVQCGRPFAVEEEKVPSGQRKAYVYALLILPVLLIAAAVGYYKFFLPDGVAAVVNGEEIRLSEIDAVISQMKGARGTAPGTGVDAEALGTLRYQVLNQLITERIALQEARKAGLTVSESEVSDAASRAKAASGLDEKAFASSVAARYGSAGAFEQKLERDLLIRKIIIERVIPAGADGEGAQEAVSRWLQNVSRNATVRIALAEQVSAAGCGCCSGGTPRSGMQGAAGAPRSPSPESAQAAADAGIRYWNEKYGGGPVTARTTDFGCHIQVDIVKENKVALSLRYQDGAISEM